MKKTAIYIMVCLTLMLTACNNKKSASTTVPEQQPVGPAFSADSAYLFCQQQCDFGPRIMNSDSHEQCGRWIADRFRQYGMEVIEQKATLRASGVAVMLEIARLLQKADSLKTGVDFICFDAEDWGTPQWSEQESDGDTWALGAQHWAANPHREGYKARFGILLDMVGGEGARFYREQYSIEYANDVVNRVWKAADVVGYSSYFPLRDGGRITDDHVPVNQVAGIPCIDIIPYYPNCEASSFGPTWHTVNDNMQHIDRNTLKAVGQTIIQVLYYL